LLNKFGDWGLGIGDWGLGPIPNPQSPKILYLFIYLSNIIFMFILMSNKYYFDDFNFYKMYLFIFKLVC